jgi:hypothetical protein
MMMQLRCAVQHDRGCTTVSTRRRKMRPYRLISQHDMSEAGSCMWACEPLIWAQKSDGSFRGTGGRRVMCDDGGFVGVWAYCWRWFRAVRRAVWRLISMSHARHGLVKARLIDGLAAVCAYAGLLCAVCLAR